MAESYVHQSMTKLQLPDKRMHEESKRSPATALSHAYDNSPSQYRSDSNDKGGFSLNLL